MIVNFEAHASNERTFLSWMGSSSILTAFASGLVVVGAIYRDRLQAAVLLPVPLLAFWASMCHHKTLHLPRTQQTRSRTHGCMPMPRHVCDSPYW